MHKRWKYASSLVVCIAMLALASAPTALSATGTESIVVGYFEGTSASERGEILATAGAVPDSSVVGLRADRATPANGVTTASLIERLRKDPRVRYAERDISLSIASTKSPNDPLLANQWHHGNAADTDIDASAGWSSKTKCSKIAVLDTGIDVTHPDLQGNLWRNSKETDANGVDDDGNGYIDDYYGVNVRVGSGSGIDNDGHGTHVAGIIGARGNNSSAITGVCWSGSIMSVKFMGRFGVGSGSDAAEGIRYAVRMGAKIINASFGSPEDSSTLHDAIKYAKEKGALLVVAAGNEGSDIDRTPVYPASYTDGNILSVAATDTTDALAAFSNYGDTAVDVAAPGVDILSTYPGGQYVTMTGTSMAAPVVAGIVGLLKAKNGDTEFADWKTAVRRKVDKPASVKNKVVYDGRANLNKAIDYIAGLD